MQYASLRFGMLDVKDDDTIEMPEGLLGFANMKKFTILDLDQYYPFRWLQSLEDSALTFAVIDPTLFRPDYKIKINQSEVDSLELKDQKDAIVIVIVTLNAEPSLTSANLQGPIIINSKNRRAKQIVLPDGEYSTKHCILQERKKYASVKTA